MQNTHDDGLRASRVTAVFGHSALTFKLWKGATLADLAGRLDDLGRRHNAAPVAIGVKFALLRGDKAPPSDPWSGSAPTPWQRRAGRERSIRP
jgi:hypothetical protein